MHFVDDIHLEASAARRIKSTLQQLAHVVYLRVGCGVQFDQIDETAAVDFLAGTTLATRRGGDARQTIQRFGKNSRNGSLADSTSTGEQIGMMQTILRKGIAQCPYDVLLPRKLREGLWAPFARKDCCA